MISRIRRLRNLGVFSDFAWHAQLPTFGRYNIIYGWNGSGKTTLSKFLAGIPAAAVEGYPDLEYELETTTGTVRTGEALAMRTRVFNRDYVANNVHRVSGKANPIFILGEDNHRIAEQIADDEAALANRRAHLAQLDERMQATAKQKDRSFTQVAQTISQNTGGSGTRTYRRPNAQKDFASLQGKALLDETDVVAAIAALRQQAKQDVPELPAPVLRTDHGAKGLPGALSALVAEGAKLCARTVESRVIDRLARNTHLSQWVENGVALHPAGATTCEFCEQALPQSRMAALVAHFNEADRQLKAEIDTLLRKLAEVVRIIDRLHFPDKANLYDDLQDGYQAAVAAFGASREVLLTQLDAFRATLAVKKTKTTEPVLRVESADAAELIARLDAANAEIKRHNTRNADFRAPKEAARKALEAHYLSTVFDDIKDAEQRIAQDEREMSKLQDGEPGGPPGITALIERIAANRATISSEHRGCDQINDALRTFLGRDELRFEVADGGYVLLRGEQVADNLSEGEKTAIGFVHFVIHLKDRDFDPVSGIIVVDDPISSLDANSMFQAFAFLKNAVQDAKQVFLMTHNFDFLQLLLNWVRHHDRKSVHYMVKDSYGPSGARAAWLDVLDQTLEKHESEYHYLFKRLYTFRCDGTIENAYSMPNIARKLLDTFLMFRVPNRETPYKKLELLKPYFDERKLSAIYKFTNDQSHITGKGLDPSLVAETRKNVQYLLEMIEKVFPEHYEILVASLGPVPPAPRRTARREGVEPAVV